MKIRLRLGDCLDLMREIPSQSVDMVLADLPYGTTQCAWDSLIDLQRLWQEYKRVCKPNAAIVLTATQPFTSALVMSNAEMFRYDLVWEKGNATGFLNAKKMPLRAHESVLVFYGKLPTYNPQMTQGHTRKTSTRDSVNTDIYGSADHSIKYDSTERYPRSVQFFSSDKQHCSLHSTQKPVDLGRWLVRTYTNAGETVLDNTMGSGSFGVAAILEGRSFWGIEKDPDIFQLAADRIKKVVNN